MKKSFLICICFFVLFSSTRLNAQNIRAKVAVVSMIDTVVTHVYGNRWYSTTFKKDIFNYGNKTIAGLTNILEASNISVVEVQTPVWVNKMALLNLVGKPSKDLKRWFEILKEELDADYLVIIFKKFEPENKISHRFLNGKQYGVATYANYPDAINMFSFVGYYIFSIGKAEEIKINANHDTYLLMDLRLDNRISFKKLIDLPDKYLKLTRDKMQNVVNTRNVEIKRALLQHLNL